MIPFLTYPVSNILLDGDLCLLTQRHLDLTVYCYNNFCKYRLLANHQNLECIRHTTNYHTLNKNCRNLRLHNLRIGYRGIRHSTGHYLYHHARHTPCILHRYRFRRTSPHCDHHKTHLRRYCSSTLLHHHNLRTSCNRLYIFRI